MSYEVTATRRRPQRFDDLVGQEFVAETLKNSIRTGKIAHAYLFSGPRGCGKTSTARILAKALNCQKGPTDCPCGVCENCQEITKGASLDVIEIDGASNTSVENIRQIKDEVLFPPSKCRYKIYIIDEVHMLSTSAFNALLKTIEEPPAYVIFIFATTELQKVPATIKSRCQQFNFRLVAIDKVKQCLSQAAGELGIQADDEALFWIARESTGSMRDSYTLFDQVVAFSDGHITYEKIRDKLGLVGVDRLNTIFENCAKGELKAALGNLDEYLQAGVSIEQLISNCADYIRSLLLIKSGVTKESLLGNSCERYSNLVLSTWNSIQLERALSIYLTLYRDIRYSLSPRYELELSFSRMSWLKDYVSNQEVRKAIDAAQNLLNAGASAKNLIEENNTSLNSNSFENRNAQGTQNQNSSNKNFQQNGPKYGSNSINNFSANLAAKNTGDSFASRESESLSSIGTNNNSLKKDSYPEGLPRLSMLASMEKQASEAGDSGNPFSNGGSLPPEQSVSDGFGYDYDGSDIEDNWTNIDEPPSETEFEDPEAYAQSIVQAYDASEDVGNAMSNIPVQLDDVFITGDGRKLSVAQLRGGVMAALSVTDGFAATTLEKTGEWKVFADNVQTSVSNVYELSTLERKIDVISAEISNICGKKMLFKVNLAKANTGNEVSAKREIPNQVKLVVDMFKGSIVGSGQ